MDNFLKQDWEREHLKDEMYRLERQKDMQIRQEILMMEMHHQVHPAKITYRRHDGENKAKTFLGAHEETD